MSVALQYSCTVSRYKSNRISSCRRGREKRASLLLVGLQGTNFNNTPLEHQLPWLQAKMRGQYGATGVIPVHLIFNNINLGNKVNLVYYSCICHLYPFPRKARTNISWVRQATLCFASQFPCRVQAAAPQSRD